MEWIGIMALAVCTVAIAYEDIHFRTVRIYWFVGLFLAVAWVQSNTYTLAQLLINFGVNLSFIILQMAILHLYYFWKNRAWSWIFDRYLGWGDVVFWGCILTAWPLWGFIAFMILSLVFSLLVYLSFIQHNQPSIPLAGLQAGCLLLTILLERLQVFSLSGWTEQLLFAI